MQPLLRDLSAAVFVDVDSMVAVRRLTVDEHSKWDGRSSAPFSIAAWCATLQSPDRAQSFNLKSSDARSLGAPIPRYVSGERMASQSAAASTPSPTTDATSEGTSREPASVRSSCRTRSDDSYSPSPK